MKPHIGLYPKQAARAAKFYARTFEQPAPRSGVVAAIPVEINTDSTKVEPSRNMGLVEVSAASTRKLKPAYSSNPRVEWQMQQMVKYLNAVKINVRNLHEWRWLEQEVGEINGLPAFRGCAVMTDGILVILEREDGSVRLAHYDFFIKDHKDNSGGEHKVRKPRKLNPEIVRKAQELFDMLCAK